MTSEDLAKPFKLPFSNFSKPTMWRDDLGFSTIENYGDGYASLYKFGIYSHSQKGDVKSLSISVVYGKETDGSISLGTGKKGIWDPLDLNFSDDFSYNENEKKFFRRGKEIQAKDILLYVEEVHKRPTRILIGFTLRNKLWFWRVALPVLIKFLDSLLIFVLWVVSGEKIKNDPLGRYVSERYDQRNNINIERKVEFDKGATMEFFGYHAKRWSVVFYCSLHLVFLLILHLTSVNYSLMVTIGRNSFLALCYVVTSFAITEALIPDLIKLMISKVTKLYMDVAFKNLQVQ